MKIAIVGAGYAGVAVAWHLLRQNMEVTLFDGGEGASHNSTGLLHSAPGKGALPTWRAEEGIAAAVKLLNAASIERPVYVKNGILRIAVNDEQRALFGGETLWVADGITVYSRLYLAGLKKACGQAHFEKRWIDDLGELDAFDAIVLTVGSGISHFLDWPLKKTVGQSLICRWPEPLAYSLLSQGHITPTENPEFCLVGSTYEHTERPDPKKALELLDRAALFYPPAKKFKIVEICSPAWTETGKLYDFPTDSVLSFRGPEAAEIAATSTKSD